MKKDDEKYILDLALDVRDYLSVHVEACVDTCGEDDDINTLPAKKALENIEKLIQTITD